MLLFALPCLGQVHQAGYSITRCPGAPCPTNATWVLTGSQNGSGTVSGFSCFEANSQTTGLGVSPGASLAITFRWAGQSITLTEMCDSESGGLWLAEFVFCGAPAQHTNYVMTLCITNLTLTPQNYNLLSTTNQAEFGVGHWNEGNPFTNLWLNPLTTWCMKPWTNASPGEVHGIGSDEIYYSSTGNPIVEDSGGTEGPPTVVPGSPTNTVPDPTGIYTPIQVPTNAYVGKSDAQVIREGFNALLNQQNIFYQSNFLQWTRMANTMQDIKNYNQIISTNGGSGAGATNDYRPYFNALLTNSLVLSSNLFASTNSGLGTNFVVGFGTNSGVTAAVNEIREKGVLPTIGTEVPIFTAPMSLLNLEGIGFTSFEDVTFDFSENPHVAAIIVLVRNFLLVMITWCFFQACISVITKTAAGVDISKG